MADPIAYNVSYSFAGWQAQNPADPLPATELDAELANVEATVDSIVAALADVRRSDGNLQNGKVTWDGLNADVKARITGTDPRVTVPDLALSAFASQIEAETGVASDKLMTPLRTKQQLDALRAFAGQAAAQAGTDNTTVMTPLRTKEQLDTLRGLATQAEAQAGADNTKTMTPLRGAQQIAVLRPALTVTAALTFGPLSPGASSVQTVTLTGALANDGVVLGLPVGGVPAGIIAQAWVSSADVVSIRLTNATNSAITPAPGQTYRVTAIRF